METAKECEKRLALTISQTNESIATILQSEENTMTIPQNNENVEKINVELLSSTTLSELKQKILRKFLLVKGMCRQCYSEKILPKKFFAENNMDPGEISHELEVLESLPQEGYIDNQLPHLQADQEDDDLNNENDYEEVTHSFVPLLPPNNHKEVAINSTLDRIDISNFIS
ncbi:17036_t:CDS:2 [Gigaspora rosea]|nr:17036_t:CDS:2 [Gigaspora rosea]